MDTPGEQNETKQRAERSFGLAAAVPLDVILAAAAEAEESGYDSFWLNNPPGADSLAALGQTARRVAKIRLGVGVIPLSAHPAERIIQAVQHHALPSDRLYLGIGSGAGSGGLRRVDEGIHAIRARLTCRIVVAALGPGMCRLAGEQADGVLLNWLTPRFAYQARAWVRDGADRAGRPVPRVMTYVRVAQGDAARERLRREAASYESIAHYAAHFKRMGASALDTAVAASTREDVQRGLAEWNGVVDEVVVRAVPARDDRESVLELLQAARPAR